MRFLALLLWLAWVLPAQDPAGSVVRVTADPGCVLQSHGSGVVVAPGIVATNAHVVQGGKGVVVRFGEATWTAQSYVISPAMDLCLLKVPGLSLPPVALATEPPALGTPIRSLGFPAGVKDRPVETTGTLQAAWHYRDNVIYQMNALLRPGNSGGGLFLPDGRLLGITTFALLTTDQAFFAVPAAWIGPLMEQPWQDARTIPSCKDRELLYYELLEHLTADPRNRAPWEAFTRAWIAAKDKDADAWFSLGHVLWQTWFDKALQNEGQVDPGLQKAIRDAFNRAVTLNPGFVKAWNNLGVILDSTGDLKGSVEAYSMALRLKPDYHLAWINLGASYIQMSRWEDAAQAFQMGIGGRTDDATSWRRLGYCEEKLRRWNKAIKAYERAWRIQPYRKEYLLDYARLLVKVGDQPTQQDLVEEIQRVRPDHLPDLLKALGRKK